MQLARILIVMLRRRLVELLWWVLAVWLLLGVIGLRRWVGIRDRYIVLMCECFGFRLCFREEIFEIGHFAGVVVLMLTVVGGA